MNAKTDESHGAVAGQVERSVRPRAWIGPVWQLMNDHIYESWAKNYPDDARHFAPLYDQAALDDAYRRGFIDGQIDMRQALVA